MSDPKEVSDGKDGKKCFYRDGFGRGFVVLYARFSDRTIRKARFVFINGAPKKIKDGEKIMESENRIAVVGILISDGESVESVNAALHDMSEFVRGRMGLPLRDRNLNAITLVLDAPADAINRLAGRLGKIDGVSAKVMYR